MGRFTLILIASIFLPGKPLDQHLVDKNPSSYVLSDNTAENDYAPISTGLGQGSSIGLSVSTFENETVVVMVWSLNNCSNRIVIYWYIKNTQLR